LDLNLNLELITTDLELLDLKRKGYEKDWCENEKRRLKRYLEAFLIGSPFLKGNGRRCF